jgi:phosphodiesterase/alkaline phosphatase D-like protein
MQSGKFTTNDSRDYTVKVDVDKLEPESTYYYK